MNSRAEASPRTRKMPEEHPRKPGTPGRLSRSAVTTETAMAESSWDDDIELYGHHPAAGLLRDAPGRAAGAAGGRCRYSRFRGPDPLRKGGKRRIVHFDADTAGAIATVTLRRARCAAASPSPPYIYVGQNDTPKAIIVSDAIWCGICRPYPEPIEMPEIY